MELVMSALPKPRFTPEQYLEMERRADYRSEYLSGEIFAMAGATEAHNLIVTNLVGELRSRLRGRPCRTYPSDMKVEVGPSGLFTYPDVSVVCGEPRFHDDRHDMVRNPKLIVEVLSASTEAYDRGAKFAQYRRLDSLTDYLLISPSEYRAELFVRQPDSQWLLSEVTGDQGVIVIASLACDLPMAEVYERVEFDPAPPLRAD
jgi:Uma2 family endonuclease